MDTVKSTAPSVPLHEEIRLEAAAHPERSHREHVEAAERTAGRQYLEDLAKILAGSWAEFHSDDL